MYHTLRLALPAHPEQVVRDMKWDWATVQRWFAAADVKKRSKKVSLRNIVSPPLSFVMIKFVALRVMINDPLADEVMGRVLDPRRAHITGCPVVEQCGPPGGGGGGLDEEGGEWEVWDEAPQGQFSRNVVVPPGQHFRTDVPPTGHEHVFFGPWSLRCAPYPPPHPSLLPTKSNDRPSLERGNKRRKPRINHTLLNCPLPILLVM